RAALMDGCAGDPPGGLLAVQGLRVAGAAGVEALCATLGLAVAIRLGAERCIVGGALTALAAARAPLLALGAELTPLRVRLASHTPAMAAAAAGFGQQLAALAWPRSEAVLVCNVDGIGRRDPAALKQALARQIDHPVQWARCQDTVAERRPRCVLELGPGSTLARLWAAAVPEVPVRSIDEFHSAQAVVDWVRPLL
ncbi:MAG: ACP S-malonyltransferase, partial [Burkholderiaceae bacterium]